MKWPRFDKICTTLPEDFRADFIICAVIINYLKIFTECTTNKVARAQTWSKYKHHNTAKALLILHQKGLLRSYLKCPGRVSDIHLNKNCGVLDILLFTFLIFSLS